MNQATVPTCMLRIESYSNLDHSAREYETLSEQLFAIEAQAIGKYLVSLFGGTVQFGLHRYDGDVYRDAEIFFPYTSLVDVKRMVFLFPGRAITGWSLSKSALWVEPESDNMDFTPESAELSFRLEQIGIPFVETDVESYSEAPDVPFTEAQRILFRERLALVEHCIGGFTPQWSGWKESDNAPEQEEAGG